MTFTHTHIYIEPYEWLRLVQHVWREYTSQHPRNYMYDKEFICSTRAHFDPRSEWTEGSQSRTSLIAAVPSSREGTALSRASRAIVVVVVEFKSPSADPADLTLTALFVTDPVSTRRSTKSTGAGKRDGETAVYKKAKSPAFTAAKWLVDCKIYNQVRPAADSPRAV